MYCYNIIKGDDISSDYEDYGKADMRTKVG